MALINESPKIIIIGGGLGGLLLAQGFKKHNISFQLFERDDHADYRPQGYRIRVTGPGIEGLKLNLSSELWTRFVLAVPTAPGGTSLDPITCEDQPSRMPERPAGGPMPCTVDRKVLRKLLLTGIEHNITFGARFAFYSLLDQNSGVTAHFENGASVTGQLLVGADGSWSTVRTQLKPKVKLVDTLGRCIYGKTLLTDELLGSFPEKACKNMTLLQDRRENSKVSLLLEPIRFPSRGQINDLPDDYIYWVLAGRKEIFGLSDDELRGLTSSDAVKLSLELTKAWNPALRSLLEKQDPVQTSALRISSMKPDSATYSPAGIPVTLIGDAAHAATAAGGLGAVNAFRDAALLASKLAETSDWAKAVDEFEAEMSVYGREAIELTSRAGANLFGMPDWKDCPVIN